MPPATNATAPPVGHPALPPGVSPNQLIAIVTVHDAEALNANRTVQHNKLNVTADGARASRQEVTGVHIFLRRIGGQHCFSFGRQRSDKVKANPDRDRQDVYIPGGSAVGIRQFSLVPDYESNSWRLQSTSEAIATVNGAPIQAYTSTTKKQPNPLPHAIYLKQSEVNVVTVNGIRVDIWLMKSVHQMYGQAEFTPSMLQALAQDVSRRPEQWARDRWNLTEEQVSGKTFRAIQRFTGELQTAKVYQNERRQRQLRDQEFLMFSKQEVDASVVRYLHSTEFTNLPAVITDSHDGFVTYAAMEAEILRSHPGVRFEIATVLLRRIFFGLGFMHFHGIIHGHFSKNSVLIKMVDGKVDRVLLVDLTTARPFVQGAPIPMASLVADGRAAMDLIDICCDIWTFRSGPTLQAKGEELMQHRTDQKRNQYLTVQRVAVDFFERQKVSRLSEKGKWLERLELKYADEWQRAQNAQVQNNALCEIKAMSKSKVDARIEEWESANAATTVIGQKKYMILSLGHPELDNLAAELYLKHWNTTPHDVCAKIETLGGALEEPWQTFEARKATTIVPMGTGFTEDSVMTWLAACAEVSPEWRQALEVEVDRHIHPQANIVGRGDIGNLYAALQGHGRLPPPMVAMMGRLVGTDVWPTPIQETYQIWYHIPSRLFNLTQLHRLATPERLRTAITEDLIPCDNFVEVRGDPKIQGCYAHLSLLVEFCNVLGLELPRSPDLAPMPTLDPSDFSTVQPARIVLARPGLLGYGSMVRVGDQCNFYNPKEPEWFETNNVFISTYFGDMPVLPKGVEDFERPEHWSKYKTAEQTEAANDVSKRRVLPAKAPDNGSGRANRPSLFGGVMGMGMDMDEDEDAATPAHETALARRLCEREAIRAEARLPSKRALSVSSSRSRSPSPASRRSRAGPKLTDSFTRKLQTRAQAPIRRGQPDPMIEPAPQDEGMGFMTASFMGRNSAGLNAPTKGQIKVNQSFTAAGGEDTLAEDWKVVDAMLLDLSDDEEGEEEHITNFRPAHSNDEDYDTGDAGNSFTEGFLDSKGNGKDYLRKGKGQQQGGSSVDGPRLPSLLGMQNSFGADGKSPKNLFGSQNSDKSSTVGSQEGSDDHRSTDPSSPPPAQIEAPLFAGSGPSFYPGGPAPRPGRKLFNSRPRDGPGTAAPREPEAPLFAGSGNSMNFGVPPSRPAASSTSRPNAGNDTKTPRAPGTQPSRPAVSSNSRTKAGTDTTAPRATKLQPTTGSGNSTIFGKQPTRPAASSNSRPTEPRGPVRQPTTASSPTDVQTGGRPGAGSPTAPMPNIFASGSFGAANASFESLPDTASQGSWSEGEGGPTGIYPNNGAAQGGDDDIPDTDVES
jgi:hypothetical protein